MTLRVYMVGVAVSRLPADFLSSHVVGSVLCLSCSSFVGGSLRRLQM